MNAGSQQEQQRRELEELRCSFAEAGAGISPFEPAEPNGKGEESASPRPEPPTPTPPPAGRPRPTWATTAAIAIACLLTSGGLGYLLHRPAPPPNRSPP